MSEKTKNIFINKDDLRDYIHSIHDDLRNSGAGYGQTGLKIFSVFYGLKLIKPHLSTLNIPIEYKKTLDWDELYKRANSNDEIIEYIDKEVLEVLWKLKQEFKQFEDNKKNSKKNNINVSSLGHFIFYQIPRDLPDKVWKDLIKKIDKIPVGYNDSGSVNLSGKLWEYFVGRDKTAISELGAYFSDRPLTEFCFNKVKPELDENGDVRTMCDIFGGSGGFTLGYAHYLREVNPDIDWKTNVDKIYHFDMEESVVNMTGLEMFAITGFFPKRDDHNFLRQNSFKAEMIGHNGITKYFYVFSNPPYGGDKNTKKAEDIKTDKVIAYIKSLKSLKSLKDDVTDELKEQLSRLTKEKKIKEAKNKKETTVNLSTCSKRINAFAKKYKILTANDKESSSLILLMDLVDVNGTCCAILKEGVFFDSKYSTIRKVLLENFNVEHVISVPQNAFENTSTKTSIIIFHNNGKTKKIKFSELIIHTIENDEFKINDSGEVVLTKTKGTFDRVEEKPVCIASMKDIKENLTKDKCLYSLNMKDYKDYKIVCPKDYELKKLSEFLEYEKKSKRNASFATENGTYRFYTSSDKIKKCSECDFNDDKLKLIFGTGGTGSLFIDDKFSCSADNFVCTIKDKYDLLYIYDYIKTNWDIFISRMFNGSTLGHINKDRLDNCEIPFPKNMDKLKPQLDKLYKIHQEIMIGTEQIPQSERDICEIIKKATDEGKKGVDYDEYKFDELVEYQKKNKKYKAADGKESGKYKFYTSSQDKIMFIDDEPMFTDECLIMGRNGEASVHYDKIFSCEHDHVYVLKTKNTRYMYYYIRNNMKWFEEQMNGSTIRGTSKDILSKFVVKVLTENKMKKLKLQEKFDEVDKLKETLEKNKEDYQKLMKELFKDFEEKDESDSSDSYGESDSSSKESESEKSKKTIPKKPIKKVSKKSESEDSEDEKSKKTIKKSTKINSSESDESEDESEDVKPKKTIKKPTKINSKKSESEDSESEDEKPKKTIPKPIKKVSKKSESEKSESENEKPKKIIKKPTKKKVSND